MTELEIMKNAEACLRFLIKGTDPFTKEAVPENDVVRKKQISKYLNFTADFLHKAIAQQQNAAPKNDSARFFVSRERAEKWKPNRESVTISKIAQAINEGISPEQDGFIPTKALSEWLESQNLLEKRSLPNGSYRRIATEQASDYGITNLYNSRGNFKSVLFSVQAQQWIYDCIDEVTEFCIQHAEEFPRLEKVAAVPTEKHTCS